MAKKKDAPLLIMPKATVVWLVDNTTLTFEQIADFCGIHALEVKAVADGDVAAHIIGKDPIAAGILTQEELDKAQTQVDYRMEMSQPDLVAAPKRRTKGPRYTPVAKRGDKPDGIAYLLKTYPKLSDNQIIKLIGTTRKTINSIREKTHAHMTEIKPRDPLLLGLCKRTDLMAAVEKAKKRAEKDAKKA